MLKLICCAAVLLAVTACNRPLRGRSETATAEATRPVVIQTGSQEGRINSGGDSRHFIVHVPRGYDGNAAVPLLLNFHGYGSNSTEEEALSGTSAKADQEGFIVVSPDAIDKAWYTGPGSDGQSDRQFVRDLIVHLEGQYDIDARRIYATGISNGGGMTDRVGCTMADRIAAIAPDAGAYNFWQDCSPARPVPVMAFHGLDDNVIPFEGGTPISMEPPIKDWAAAWAQRNGCEAAPAATAPVEGASVYAWSGCKGKAEVILYVLANHGHSWPGSPGMPRAITSQTVNATDVMWEFFQKHPRP